jgi:hypothetical protein
VLFLSTSSDPMNDPILSSNHPRRPPACDPKVRLRQCVLLALLLVATLALGVRVALNPQGFLAGLSALIHGQQEDGWSDEGSGSKGGLIEQDGRTLLWGGPTDSMHFDVSETILPLDGLRYGLGREAFPALIEPRFVSVSEAARWIDPSARVLLVQIGDEVKIYPVQQLIRHEVVNDIIGGRAIFAAYCILADLGAVYDREMDGHTFTFALSGYTCSHPDVWDGRDAFVLWDRDTESLWWPTLGKAVSGPMLGANLKLLDPALWRQTTWAKARAEYPTALVLDKGQDFDRPVSWPRLDRFTPIDPTESPELAPRWGENP